jgi:hypothetical protein
MDHILFHCEEINAQRELLKLQMGTWAASKEDLITKYKNDFLVFIESIDFDCLKLGNHCKLWKKGMICLQLIDEQRCLTGCGHEGLSSA